MTLFGHGFLFIVMLRQYFNPLCRGILPESTLAILGAVPMRRVAICIATVIALSGTSALAADMAVKAPPPAPVVASDWTGFYVGLNGGKTWGADPSYAWPGGQFFTVSGPGTVQSYTAKLPDAGLAGGQVGFDLRVLTAWVLGVELSGDWLSSTKTVTGPLGFPSDMHTSKLQGLDTATVRFGYAPGSWLIYGKGGAAVTRLELSGISGPPTPGVVYSSSLRRTGSTAGFGVEYLYAQHFILGVEYDYAMFGSGQNVNTLGYLGAVTTPVNFNPSKFDLQSVVGRISYKF